MLKLSLFDKFIVNFDNVLRSSSNSSITVNNSPAANINNSQQLDPREHRHVVSMMRINHSGEICAQALYQGQALLARDPQQYSALQQAASEENDHLTWCAQRLQELNARPSLLNPIWYAGSFSIGAMAAFAGDQISMGFLAETERQVTQHLEKHLQQMPAKDQKSIAILKQMRSDELQHATQAELAGAAKLPSPIKKLMKYTAKILTITAAKI